MSFPALPREIRLQIWSLVYYTEPPCVVAIETNTHRLPSPSPGPLTYNICHEARAETLYQARRSNHTIPLKYEVAKEGENPTDQIDLWFEIIYRHDIDILLVCDSNIWPRRPPWADIPTEREKQLPTPQLGLQPEAAIKAVFPHGWWSLFKQCCNPRLVTSVAIEVTPAECDPYFHRRGGVLIHRVEACLEGLPHLCNITFVLPAFRCLSANEKNDIRRFMNYIASLVKRRRPVTGTWARKRAFDEDALIHTRICVWRGGRLCPQGSDDDEERAKIRYFVRDIPRFGRAMRAAVNDMATNSGSCQ